MTHYDVRLYTDKGSRIHDTRIECKPTEIPEMLACVMMDYLGNASYPDTMQARVVAGKKYTEYMLLLKNDAVDVYRHVLRASRVEAQEDPAGFYGASRQGECRLMTRYTVQLYSDGGDQIHNRGIDCNRKDVPDMLAGVVASYLKGAPYPGAIRALVNSGWNYRTYLILLKNDFLDVYRHVCHADRAEVQE